MVQLYSRYKKSNSEYRLLLGLKKYNLYIRIIRSCNIRDVVNSNFDKIEKERKALKNQFIRRKKKKSLRVLGVNVFEYNIVF